ncbi:hypothetical protein [Chryseobacterium sp. CFS15]|uniref:hypothetical protein n=1 Tax=Chryseobacterium sp. CFS15 TaxID=2986946 RepID=UPI00280A42CD|nr:hypothetical protein [Chryseobacterium sp. CFS15]MDQ8141451.1 hypothetical protein [Chryseobacterium sp. CFS15]
MGKKARKKLIVPIAVDKKYLARTLLIVDFLVKLIEFRRHHFGFDINDQNIIKILDREIHISIPKVANYVTIDDSKYSSRDFVMTELLCVQTFEDTWNRNERKKHSVFCHRRKINSYGGLPRALWQIFK